MAVDRSGGRRAVAGVAALLAAVLLAGCVPPPTTTVRGATTVEMDASWGSGFFSLPWPNDVRRTADGTLDLAGIPSAGNPVLAALFRAASEELTGHGTNAAAYLRTTGPVDPDSLPSPSDSAAADSPVQLVALDGTDRRVPVIVRVEPADGFRPRNLLSLLPYPGHAMSPATTYAVVVTSGVRDLTGAPLAPAPLIDALDEPFRAGLARSSRHWSALRAQRDRARDVLARSGHWRPEDLVGFSEFRTQDSTALMGAVAAAVDRFPVAVPDLEPVGDCEPGTGRRHLTGRLVVPRFQAGNTTRTGAGGRIAVGDDGVAVVQRTATIGVGVNVPCAPAPEGGWAIQTYLDGTGANVRVEGGFGRAATATVIGSIAPLYSPAENGDAYNELLFYNFLNPAAARTNPIQQAADNLVLIRMLQLLELDGEPFGSATPVRTRDDRVVVTGHSQGAQTVALVASSSPDVVGIVTSAATSGQYNSISYRSDVREIIGAVLGTRRGIDVRNPLVQVIQTLMDAVEPANFPTTGHWLNFAGRDDGCLTLEASRHLAGSQGLTVVDPQWPSIWGDAALDPVVADLPVAGNGPGGTTRVSVEAPGAHRVAFGNTALVGAFIDAMAAGDTPTVPDSPIDVGPPDSCTPRFGEIGSHG
jgi:hypothetical protein